jgi:hypothetical protein
LLATEEIGKLSKEVERDLFRVVQEALAMFIATPEVPSRTFD